MVVRELAPTHRPTGKQIQTALSAIMPLIDYSNICANGMKKSGPGKRIKRVRGYLCYTAHSLFVFGMPVMQAVKYHVLTTNGVFHIYNELCFKCTR